MVLNLPTQPMKIFMSIPELMEIKQNRKGDLHIPAFTSTSTSIHRAAKFVSEKEGTPKNITQMKTNGKKTYSSSYFKNKSKKGQQVGAYSKPQ